MCPDSKMHIPAYVPICNSEVVANWQSACDMGMVTILHSEKFHLPVPTLSSLKLCQLFLIQCQLVMWLPFLHIRKHFLIPYTTRHWILRLQNACQQMIRWQQKVWRIKNDLRLLLDWNDYLMCLVYIHFKVKVTNSWWPSNNVERKWNSECLTTARLHVWNYSECSLLKCRGTASLSVSMDMDRITNLERMMISARILTWN